ncbi:UDP-glucose 4-epimerase [Serratia proteamaculans]|nr:UDP-glucose 4-epimerase [Serratia proteamaculans]
MAILVTGGAGYIGSHTVLALLEYGDGEGLNKKKDVGVQTFMFSSSARAYRPVKYRNSSTPLPNQYGW